MAALWKYDIVVLTAAETKERDERLWEMGRAGWELVSVLVGDWKNGQPEDTTKMTWFLKREATHDIGF
jgi:hypothetical protein